jgi:tRNA(Arg) A34 adenosine deaminase TadA
MINHETFIKLTYDLAKSAQGKGNHPFGALLVVDGQVVLTAENTVTTDSDITRHAEFNLVSAASQKLDRNQLEKSILYTSTEPCAMCSGAIYWAGISNIVFGCSAVTLGNIAGGGFVVPCRDLLQYGSREIHILGPVLEQLGADIHRGFW